MLEKLFRKYNPIERPVENDTESLNVTIGLALQQIVDVVSGMFQYISVIQNDADIQLNKQSFKDQKKQTIVFSGWLDMVN